MLRRGLCILRAMRRCLCQIVAVAIFVMGLEGSIDVVSAHPDASTIGHAPAAFHDEASHDDSASDPDSPEGHCGHYCHGHIATLPASSAVPSDHVPVALAIETSELRLDFGDAPPTPPPNF